MTVGSSVDDMYLENCDDISMSRVRQRMNHASVLSREQLVEEGGVSSEENLKNTFPSEGDSIQSTFAT